MTNYHFVKVSNESPESALPRSQLQVCAQNGPSRAIRKIHIVRTGK